MRGLTGCVPNGMIVIAMYVGTVSHYGFQTTARRACILFWQRIAAGRWGIRAVLHFGTAHFPTVDGTESFFIDRISCPQPGLNSGCFRVTTTIPSTGSEMTGPLTRVLTHSPLRTTPTAIGDAGALHDPLHGARTLNAQAEFLEKIANGHSNVNPKFSKPSEITKKLKAPPDKLPAETEAAIQRGTEWFQVAREMKTVAKRSTHHIKSALLKHVHKLLDGSIEGEWKARYYLSDVANEKHGIEQKSALRSILKSEIKNAFPDGIRLTGNLPYSYNDLMFIGNKKQNLIDLALHHPRYILDERKRIGGRNFDRDGGRVGDHRADNIRENDLIPVRGALGAMAKNELDRFVARWAGISPAAPEMDAAVDRFLAQFDPERAQSSTAQPDPGHSNRKEIREPAPR
jgi:hypothetical protein